MTTPAVAITSLDAERLAAEAEGTFIPTEDEKQKINRYRALNARKNKIETEMEAIESDLQRSMAARGALRLAIDGKNVVQWAVGNKRELDEDALAKAKPEVVTLYQEATKAYKEAAAAFTKVTQTLYGSFRIKK